MKNFVPTLVILCLFATAAVAQNVGIGTENPQTALHVAGANESADGLTPGALADGDGVVVSRVSTNLSAGTVTTGCSAARRGAMVYSNNAVGAGFYVCNGTSWTAVRPNRNTRVTTTNTITNADLNGYIIFTGTGTAVFNLATLTPSNGDILTISDAAPSGSVQVSGVAAGSRNQPNVSNQGALQLVFVAGSGWYHISGF